MRPFLRIAAGVVMAISCIALIMGVIELLTQTGTEQIQAATLFGSGLAGSLFSGIAWTVVDIANAVAPEGSGKTPSSAAMEAVTQQLSDLSDDELTRLSHNTSRGLPEYRAIMEEMAKRKRS